MLEIDACVPELTVEVAPDANDVTVFADPDTIEFVETIDDICVAVPLENTLDVPVAILPCAELADDWAVLVKLDCVADGFVEACEPKVANDPGLVAIEDTALIGDITVAEVAVTEAAVELNWVAMVIIVWEADIEPVIVGTVAVPADAEVTGNIVLDADALPVALDPPIVEGGVDNG